MAYVISQSRIGKRMPPASGFVRSTASTRRDDEGFEQAEQLFIDPDECLDWDACVSSCPVDAPMPASELPTAWAEFEQRNADFFANR